MNEVATGLKLTLMMLLEERRLISFFPLFFPIYVQELDRQVPLIDEIDTKVRNLSLQSELCLSNQIMQTKLKMFHR